MSRRVVDLDDPDNHRNAARRACRRRCRELRDMGYSTAQILSDRKFRYWHEIAYTLDQMRKEHARKVVGGVYAERGNDYPRSNYGKLEPVQQSFVYGDEELDEDDDDAGVSQQMAWVRVTEKMLNANPLEQAAVLRSRLGILEAQLENMPRRGLRFRVVRREINHLITELNRLLQ